MYEQNIKRLEAEIDKLHQNETHTAKVHARAIEQLSIQLLLLLFIKIDTQYQLEQQKSEKIYKTEIESLKSKLELLSSDKTITDKEEEFMSKLEEQKNQMNVALKAVADKSEQWKKLQEEFDEYKKSKTEESIYIIIIILNL